METRLVNGREIALEIEKQITQGLSKLDYRPVICDIAVGADPVQEQFVRVKKLAAQRAGFGFEVRKFGAVSSQEIFECIGELNDRKDVCGIIVQLPLPFNKEDSVRVLDAIPFEKDIDCLSTKSKNLFYAGSANCFTPPVAMAVTEILGFIPGGISKKLKYLVIGQGALVGRPVFEMLLRQGLDVKKADKSIEKGILKKLMLEADVAISGTGVGRSITGSDIKQGAIVIDCGTSGTGGSIVGDVDKESVLGKAAWLSPVPGGVGPVAVSKLLDNAFKAVYFIISIKVPVVRENLALSTNGI